MIRHPAWAVCRYSSGPLAARTAVRFLPFGWVTLYVQHRFMSLALEVCGGASVLERRLRSVPLSWFPGVACCVPPSISGAGHATRGKGCWRRKEGSQGAKQSQEIEIAVVGDDYSARASSNRPRAAGCPLSSFQRTHSFLQTTLLRFA